MITFQNYCNSLSNQQNTRSSSFLVHSRTLVFPTFDRLGLMFLNFVLTGIFSSPSDSDCMFMHLLLLLLFWDQQKQIAKILDLKGRLLLVESWYHQLAVLWPWASDLSLCDKVSSSIKWINKSSQLGAEVPDQIQLLLVFFHFMPKDCKNCHPTVV